MINRLQVHYDISMLREDTWIRCVGKLCLCKVFIDMSIILDIDETCLITNLSLVGFYTHKEIRAKLTIVEDISSRLVF